jgi:hypothetical protein
VSSSGRRCTAAGGVEARDVLVDLHVCTSCLPSLKSRAVSGVKRQGPVMYSRPVMYSSAGSPSFSSPTACGVKPCHTFARQLDLHVAPGRCRQTSADTVVLCAPEISPRRCPSGLAPSGVLLVAGRGGGVPAEGEPEPRGVASGLADVSGSATLQGGGEGIPFAFLAAMSFRGSTAEIVIHRCRPRTCHCNTWHCSGSPNNQRGRTSFPLRRPSRQGTPGTPGTLSHKKQPAAIDPGHRSIGARDPRAGSAVAYVTERGA